eukprot:763199-Hanusia_phi.AAC.1
MPPGPALLISLPNRGSKSETLREVLSDSRFTERYEVRKVTAAWDMGRQQTFRAAGFAILAALGCLVVLERAENAHISILSDAEGFTVREPNGDEIEMNAPGWKQWVSHVEESGADRELGMYEVNQGGKTSVREPNGDEIEMNAPGWK